MNYHKNQQLIATARSDNPRAPEYQKPKPKIIATGKELERWLIANVTSEEEWGDYEEQFYDQGYIEVDE